MRLPSCRHQRAASLLAALLLGIGCTRLEPSAPSAEYFGLVPKVRQTDPATVVSSENCPPFEAPASPGVDRRISGSTGTLTVPPQAQIATFGRAPGSALLVPGEGLIGIAFDGAMAVRLSSSEFGRRLPQYRFFDWTCSVTVGGREGTLFFNAFGFGPNGRLDPEMLLDTTTPDGRPVTVTLSADNGSTEFLGAAPAPDEENVAVRRLLARVGTLQW